MYDIPSKTSWNASFCCLVSFSFANMRRHLSHSSHWSIILVFFACWIEGEKCSFFLCEFGLPVSLGRFYEKHTSLRTFSVKLLSTCNHSTSKKYLDRCQNNITYFSTVGCTLLHYVLYLFGCCSIHLNKWLVMAISRINRKWQGLNVLAP